MNKTLLVGTLILIVAKINGSSAIKEKTSNGQRNMLKDEYSKEFKDALKDLEDIVRHESHVFDNTQDENDDLHLEVLDNQNKHIYDETDEILDEEGNDSNEVALQHDDKRPFGMGNYKYKFGKRFFFNDDRDSSVDYPNKSKRPFVLSGHGFGKFGKRSEPANTLVEEKKRPFVMSGGYRGFKFGKRKFDTNVDNGDPERFHLGDIRDEAIRDTYKNNEDEYNDEVHGTRYNMGLISKRPFVMVGGFNRFNGKRPSARRPPYLPLHIGSGFRFGKRGSWDSKAENELKYDQVLDEENQMVERPFVMYGGRVHGAGKRLIYFGDLNHRENSPSSYDKRLVDMNAYDYQNGQFEEKRPSMMGFGEIPYDLSHRSYNFRNDDLFNQLRQTSDMEETNRDEYLTSHEPFSGEYLSFPSTHGFPGHITKRPFTIGGTYRTRIGKRPFVFNGRRNGFKFGK